VLFEAMAFRNGALALSTLCPLAGAAADRPLGHADFMPTPEHPVGWRGVRGRP
jgi:hypothetical protein